MLTFQQAYAIARRTRIAVLLSALLGGARFDSIQVDEARRIEERERAERAARQVAENVLGAQRNLRPEEYVEAFLRQHAPLRPFACAVSNKFYLRGKRRQFLREVLGPYKGVPSRNGHEDGRPALLNRAARRALAGRLQFA